MSGKRDHHEVWITFKWTNIHVIGVIEGKGMTERIYEDING